MHQVERPIEITPVSISYFMGLFTQNLSLHIFFVLLEKFNVLKEQRIFVKFHMKLGRTACGPNLGFPLMIQKPSVKI